MSKQIITLQEWLKSENNHFGWCDKTVRRKIVGEDFPGKKLGRDYWIDIEKAEVWFKRRGFEFKAS